MSQSSVKLVTIPNANGHAVLGISLKVAGIPLVSALRCGLHIVPLKSGHYIDIQDAIRWYRAANDAASVASLIAAAQRGRAILAQQAAHAERTTAAPVQDALGDRAHDTGAV